MNLKKDLSGDDLDLATVPVDKLYPNPISLSKDKQKDLTKLKSFLPEHAKQFLDAFIDLS